MAKKKVFISYDYDNDKHYKNLLLAWDKNSEFDFGFSDQSADVSIQSTGAAAIKHAISAKINAVTYFLCIVGEKTRRSSWVSWEIKKNQGTQQEARRRKNFFRKHDTKRTIECRSILGDVIHL